MDGSSKSKTAIGPPPRRPAQKCQLERFGVSRCRRSASRKSTGKRRASKKKQLQYCPISTNNNSDSDVNADHHLQKPRTHNINERIAIEQYTNSDTNTSVYINPPLRSHVPSIFSNHPSAHSLCFKCGDRFPHSNNSNNSPRSLPNYFNNLDNPSIDLSPDNSSGPISFDSGIDQHNSLPYIRSLNSSPYTAVSKTESHKLYSREHLDLYLRHLSKSYAGNVKSNEQRNSNNDVNNELNITITNKSTKTVETQTDWVPLRIVNSKKLVPSKIYVEGWKTIEAANRKVQLLQISKSVARNLTDKAKLIKHPSPSSIALEEDFERGYQSDTATGGPIQIIMPVGTSFENSAMKSSFSLSSLQATGGGCAGVNSNGSPMHVPGPPERPYHSLTKKRKDPTRELWRRSWGSTHSNQSAQSLGSSATLAGKDDFWAALQQNYNYIMDNNLIDTCKEANGEMNQTTPLIPTIVQSNMRPAYSPWSIRQLNAEFTEICQWLTSMQEEVYGSPENLANKALRAARMKELMGCENRRRRFLEQSAIILAHGGNEAAAEATWRARHLNLKWNSVLQSMSTEDALQSDSNHNNADAEHEVKCLRRWLHEMEDRLQPLSIMAASSWSRIQLIQKAQEHQVLQREVQWQGRIVSSVVRLCRHGPSEEAARALECRWHHLYLRSLEWQFHLENCLTNVDSKELVEYPVIENNEGPVVKHRRLTDPSGDADQDIPGPSAKPLYSDEDSYSEDDGDDHCDGLVPDCYDYKDTSPGSDADTEGSVIDDNDIIMSSLQTGCDDKIFAMPLVEENFKRCMSDDQVVIDSNKIDEISGLEITETLNTSMYDEQQTPPTVVKRQKKPVDFSKFNRSNRSSKNLATFYFKHHDTDSDRQVVSGASGNDEKSQEETSEEEWTYTNCEKDNSAQDADVMTSSVEEQTEIFNDIKESDLKSMLESCNNELNKSNSNIIYEHDNMIIYNKEPTYQTIYTKENIKQLVNQAEEMVLKMNPISKDLVKSSGKKSKINRSFKPLVFNESSNGVATQIKISRIREWLRQHSKDKHSDNSQLKFDSCDASGEYTTGDSDPDRLSVTSEELSPSIATYKHMSSQEHSINAMTPTNQSTPEHTKVIMRRKRNSTSSARPWSVSCLSQITPIDVAKTSGSGNILNTPSSLNDTITYERTSGMSISESALNTLTMTPQNMGGCSPNRGKYQGSLSSVKTTVQGNISSSATLIDGCNEQQSDSKQSLSKRKRFKLRKRNFRNASFDLESVDKIKEGHKLTKSCSFSGRSELLRDKFERSAASDPSSSRNKHRFDSTSTSGNDSEDNVKLHLLSRVHRSTDRTLNALSSEDNDEYKQKCELVPKFKLGREGGLVRPRLPLLAIAVIDKITTDLGNDRDSDLDKSIQTAGTEEHSSFSEQAWDSYQEKYNSEPYSEAPDSDAARRLLEFGDDYRAHFDSQSDCCSSLSAHPDHEPSPLMGRRRFRVPNYSPTDNSMVDKTYKAFNSASMDYNSYGRRSKKSSSSSIDRKKTLLDSLERSKKNSESEKLRRSKNSLDRKMSKKSDCDSNRYYTSSNSTNSDNNTSLEMHYLPHNKSDCEEKAPRRLSKELIVNNLPLSVELAENDSCVDSPLRRKRYSNSHADDSSDDINGPNKLNRSLTRRKGSSGIAGLYSGPNGDYVNGFDSDSEDDVQHLIERSRSQLEATESVLAKEDITPDLLQPNDYIEIVTTCRENIRCLEAVLASASQGDSSILSIPQIRDIREIVSRWAGVLSVSEKRGAARTLRRELLTMRGYASPLPPGSPLHTRPQILNRLDQLKKKQESLQEQKASMLNMNVSVHRLLTDVGNNTSGSTLTDTLCQNLKDEVGEMYRMWENANESTNSEITQLEEVLRVWGAWEQGLAELQGALKGDSATLRLIEAALAAGDPARVAPHVSHVARLLSETTQQKGECGSWSDSGISDSGSEQDLSERERRLTNLRVLARAMETALAPGSQLLKAIAKRMDEAENELRALQTACRALIVRTAGSVNTNFDKDILKAFVLSNSTPIEPLVLLNGNNGTLRTSPDDPESEPNDSVVDCGNMKRWAWCALPLQLCLFALVCACLFGGPRCCDAVNNLGSSFTPHLRYVKGPPPI